MTMTSEGPSEGKISPPLHFIDYDFRLGARNCTLASASTSRAPGIESTTEDEVDVMHRDRKYRRLLRPADGDGDRAGRGAG